MDAAQGQQRAMRWGTRHADMLMNVAFCLTACEIFFIYRNFRTPEVGLGRYGVPMLGSLIATSFALVVCLGMLAAYLLAGKKVARRPQFAAAALCMSGASLVQLVAGHGLDQGWASLPCVGVSSLGCAFFVPELVRRMASRGVSNMVRCCIGACAVLLFVAPLSNVVPFSVFAVVMCILPIGMLACFTLAEPAQPRMQSAEGAEGQKIPCILLLTILLGSLMEGVVAGLDETAMDWQGKLLVFSVAFVASAVVVYATLLHWRGSYNSAIFRQCIPVMVAGIAVFVVGGNVALNLGSFIFLVGRQMFISVVLALVVYMIRYLESDYYLLSLGVMLGATLGSVAGQLLFRVFEAPQGELLSPTFIVLLMLFVFVAAMYLSDASNLKTRWGMIAIDDCEENVGMTIEQRCRVIAQSKRLTPREQEIMMELARGKDRQSIAAKLFISEGTVKVHTRNLYQKLGIHSKQELIVLVEETGEQAFE